MNLNSLNSADYTQEPNYQTMHVTHTHTHIYIYTSKNLLNVYARIPSRAKTRSQRITISQKCHKDQTDSDRGRAFKRAPLEVRAKG